MAHVNSPQFMQQLRQSCANGDVVEVQLMMEPMDRYVRALIYQSLAADGRLDTIEFLWNKAHVKTDLRDSVEVAASNNRREVVQFLLQAQPRILIPWALLNVVEREDGDVAIIEMLLERSAKEDIVMSATKAVEAGRLDALQVIFPYLPASFNMARLLRDAQSEEQEDMVDFLYDRASKDQIEKALLACFSTSYLARKHESVLTHQQLIHTVQEHSHARDGLTRKM